MEYFAEIITAFIIGWVGYFWWQRKRYRVAADNFKQLLISVLPNYESSETALAALITAEYPEHNEEFNQFLKYVPRRKKAALFKQWSKYTEIYSFFQSAGVFAPIMSELPHPDFDPTLENALAVERKRKKQIASILRDLIERL